MQTTSILIQTLCVPCGCRCRYCLLSWDGTVTGAEWTRSVRTAERFLAELREALPEVNSSFSFGCSMEHPQLREALRTLRRLGSPQASFLQCDGMRMRDDAQCRELMEMLLQEGVEGLNFTLYGLQAYHDRFAGRQGDYALILRMMRAAALEGLAFTAGIPLTQENVHQANELIGRLQQAGCAQLRLFIPHEEGRGIHLSPIRLRRRDLDALSPDARRLLNEEIYRTEADWLKLPDPAQETRRLLLVTLRRDNIEAYERLDALSLVRSIEALDEAYYQAFPDFSTLAEMYGDAAGDRFYRIRDLAAHYRRQYAQEHGLKLYDVTDETQSGSRRY